MTRADAILGWIFVAVLGALVLGWNPAKAHDWYPAANMEAHDEK